MAWIDAELAFCAQLSRPTHKRSGTLENLRNWSWQGIIIELFNGARFRSRYCVRQHWIRNFNLRWTQYSHMTLSRGAFDQRQTLQTIARIKIRDRGNRPADPIAEEVRNQVSKRRVVK
jgi:hypothetical protein